MIKILNYRVKVIVQPASPYSGVRELAPQQTCGTPLLSDCILIKLG